MPQENVEVVRSLYSTFSELAEGGDVASYVIAYYNPEIEYQPVEEQATIRGRDALVRWNERWFDGWDEFRVDVEELIEAGDDVVVSTITAHGRGAGSGMNVNQRFFHVFDLREHKVRRVREYSDRREALEAAGLEG